MRVIRLKSANWMLAMALLALPGALITSCSKDTDPTENVEPKGDKLTISVSGIKKQTAGGPSLKQSSVGSKGLSAATPAHKVYEFSDVDMAVSVGNNVPVKTVNLASKTKRGGLAADAGDDAEVVEDGVKYVVYLYEGATLVTSMELEAGTQGEVSGLDPEGSYDWVALSYSSKDEAPELQPGDDIELPTNQDVLYKSGKIDLAQSSTIDILFDHVYSRIAVELNTIGAFGEIAGTPAISVEGLNLAGGRLKLSDGTLTAGSTYAAELSYADFERLDDEYGDQMIAYLYTAPVSEQSAKIKMQNLEIEHADGGLNRTYFASEGEIDLNVEPEAGKSHHMLLNVVESPLVTAYNDRTVKWGRSNLYWRGDNGGLRNYAFYAENKQTARGDGYFSFGGTVPMKFATAATEGDPCALVYPQGLWKQPSKADFGGFVRGDIKVDELTDALGGLGQVVDATGLTGLVNIITNLLGNTVSVLVNTKAPNSSLGPDPYVYGEYAVSGGKPQSGSNAFGDASSASNNLRFYYNGQISNVNVLSEVADGDGLLNVGLNDISADISGIQIANLNLPLLDSYGRSTALWTHEQGTNILGLVGAGTWGYYGNAGRSFSLLRLGDRFHMANSTGELLNGVSLAGIDVLGTSFKNVRCVRAE